MGLLMSESMPFDPMLDDTSWMHERISEWMYAVDAGGDAFRYEVTKIDE